MNESIHFRDMMKKVENVDQYIASCAEEARPMLRQLRELVKKNAPQALEGISYGMPYYSLEGRLLYFAAHTHHIGLYAMPSAMREFSEELASYKTSAGTIQFPLGKRLPLALIGRMIRFRVQENLAKAASKKTAKKAVPKS